MGKTLVSAALASNLYQKNILVKVAKPIETGCQERAGDLPYAADAERLRVNAGSSQSIDEVVFHRFLLPVAPNVAAMHEGVEIEVHSLVEKLRRISDSCDLLIIEGAGGVLVPLLDTYTFADLAAELGAYSVLVVASRLGCLNHAQLSVEALQARSLPLLGYVFNDMHQGSSTPQEHSEGPALETNRETLSRLLSHQQIEEVGYRQIQSEMWLEPSQQCSAAAQTALASFSDTIIEHFGLKR